MIRLIGGEPDHEFERPICLSNYSEKITYAYTQIDLAEKSYRSELENVIEELNVRHSKIKRSLYANLVSSIKEEGIWPKDWQEKDHLMLKNDVIFQARCNGHGE